MFSDAADRLKVDKMLGHPVLYVLRHSGASANAWSKHRDLTAIQSRGRWKSANTVRRYAKGGARGTSAQFVFGPSGPVLRGVIEVLRGNVLGAAHAFAPASSERRLKILFCVELFAGSARFVRVLGKFGH